MLQNPWRTAVWDTSRNAIQSPVDRASLRHDPFRSLITPTFIYFCFRIVLLLPLIAQLYLPASHCFISPNCPCFSIMLLSKVFSHSLLPVQEVALYIRPCPTVYPPVHPTLYLLQPSACHLSFCYPFHPSEYTFERDILEGDAAISDLRVGGVKGGRM